MFTSVVWGNEISPIFQVSCTLSLLQCTTTWKRLVTFTQRLVRFTHVVWVWTSFTIFSNKGLALTRGPRQHFRQNNSHLCHYLSPVHLKSIWDLLSWTFAHAKPFCITLLLTFKWLKRKQTKKTCFLKGMWIAKSGVAKPPTNNSRFLKNNVEESLIKFRVFKVFRNYREAQLQCCHARSSPQMSSLKICRLKRIWSFAAIKFNWIHL